MAAARYNASIIFLPILALLLVATVGFFFVFSAGVMQAVANDPQSVAGPAQLVGATNAVEDHTAVTTGAKELTPSEEARPLPEGKVPQARP